MKKVFFLFLLSAISFTSFAWKGSFTTSCGVTLSVNSGTDSLTRTLNYLKDINYNVCGTREVRITFP